MQWVMKNLSCFVYKVSIRNISSRDAEWPNGLSKMLPIKRSKIEIMENQKLPKKWEPVSNVKLELTQPNQCILSDQKLEVDGVIYRELKSLDCVIQDRPRSTRNSRPVSGKEEQVLVHTRSIGDKNYTVKKINLEGSDPSNEETEEVLAENNLTSDEVCAFQEAWDKNWNPSLDQPKEGGIIGFFKKTLGYE